MSQWQTAGKVRMTPRGIWSASTAYVVLDCVSNTDKTAYYVAKQNVPAGTLLTNTEYWEVVNDISDIVSQLTNEIERLEDIVALGYPTVSGAGKFINAEGTIDAPPSGLTIYGKSVQSDGTPSPFAPADIVTAGSSGTLAMVSAGKNLVDYHAITPTGANATVTEVENGVRITCTRGEFAGGSIVERCRVPGTYTLSFDATVNLLAQGGNRIGFRHGDTNTFINAVTCETSGHYKVTATINVPFYLTFAVSRATSAAGDVTFTNIMLVRESNEAEYVPYVGITSAIDTTQNGLPGIPVASGGNYTDTDEQGWLCDTIDLEAGTWTKRCGVVTLDGSENWIASTQVAGRYYLASTYTPNAVPYASHLCTHAVANPGSSTSDTGKSFFASGANFDINTEYASVDAFKAALATTNMVLVYALVAPVVTQLTEAQIAALCSLHSRKGQTNLYSADPSVPEFNVKLYIDIPTYINSLVN